MDWEENDPFDSIVREFFGESPKRRRRSETFTEGEEEDRVIDFIETDEKVYLIFELQGLSQKDISISIKDKKIEVQVKKKSAGTAKEYLLPRMQQGISIRKTLPENIKLKTMKSTYENGILEVSFNKDD